MKGGVITSMNKLISNPTECGYRKQLFTRLGFPFGYGCTHKEKEKVFGVCNFTDVFPKLCPLQNGTSIANYFLKSAEALQNMMEYELKRIALVNGKKAYLKRNRKDCISHRYVSNIKKGRCTCVVRNIGLINYPTCKGVTCGDFKTK